MSDLPHPRSWVRDGEQRTSPDGRFTIAPAVRASRRGGGTTTDGWDLTDTAAGTERRHATLNEAARTVQRVLDQESRISEDGWAAEERVLDGPARGLGAEITFRHEDGRVEHVLLGKNRISPDDYQRLVEDLHDRIGQR